MLFIFPKFDRISANDFLPISAIKANCRFDMDIVIEIWMLNKLLKLSALAALFKTISENE